MPVTAVKKFRDKLMWEKALQQKSLYSDIFAEYHNNVAGAVKTLTTKFTSDNINYARIWRHNTQARDAITNATNKLNTKLKLQLMNDINWAHEASNDLTDQFVDEYISKLPLTPKQTAPFFTRNLSGVEGYMSRKDIIGQTPSDKVWKIAKSAQDQLQSYVVSGIGTGRSAKGISQDLRSLLQNPDKTFHRVRDAKGNLVPSKPMADFHPGRGVYRSPYKNALRLAGTETNMAYHRADSMRWNKLSFVIGIEVHLSNNHPKLDICDSAVGLYGKDFVFMGWHPACRCYATPVLTDPKTFANQLKAGIKPTQVTGIPKSFMDFMKKNEYAIKKMPVKPFWYTANLSPGGMWMKLAVSQLPQQATFSAYKPFSPLDPFNTGTPPPSKPAPAPVPVPAPVSGGNVAVPRAKKPPKTWRDTHTTPVIPDELTHDAVSMNMIDSETAIAYLQYKKEYEQFFANEFSRENIEEFMAFNCEKSYPYALGKVKNTLRRKMDDDFEKAIEACSSWQGSTLSEQPMKLKFWASKLEKNANEMTYSAKWLNNNTPLTEYSNGPTKTDYLRLRAFNQAFMSYAPHPEKRLWRGIGGNTGSGLRDKFQASAEGAIEINNVPLSGYSTKPSVAKGFGINNGGVTITEIVKNEDVYIHQQLLSGTTGRFEGEHEIIVLTRTKRYRRSQFLW